MQTQSVTFVCSVIKIISPISFQFFSRVNVTIFDRVPINDRFEAKLVGEQIVNLSLYFLDFEIIFQYFFVIVLLILIVF